MKVLANKLIEFGSYWPDLFSCGFAVMSEKYPRHFHIIIDLGFWYIQFTWERRRNENSQGGYR